MRWLFFTILILMFVFPLSADDLIGEAIERVSISTEGAGGDSSSHFPSISADGRFIAFTSDASNLVTGDTNGNSDIFVHDRDTGATTRVSVSSTGAEGNQDTSIPSISADGRFVAFESAATNLVTGDTNGSNDIFVHDRDTGATTRVSVSSTGAEGNGSSYYSSISGDGRFVAFQSNASNLVIGDTNGNSDVFVRDRNTGDTTCVSVSLTGTDGNYSSHRPFISADGKYVAFTSYASNLVIGDTNDSYPDIFVRDRDTGVTTRVSSSVFLDSISADGRFIAFTSDASNLVTGDTNGRRDVFVRDRDTGATTRVSVSSVGAEGNASSYFSSISANGRFVTFSSIASNLVTGDTNGMDDIFVHDQITGGTTRVSSSGIEENLSYFSSISADGKYVAFESYATNLVPGDANGTSDIFVSLNPMAADLQLGLEAAISPTQVNIRFDINNLGPAVANGVILNATLPSGILRVSSNPRTCTGHRHITCNLGDLAVGRTRVEINTTKPAIRSMPVEGIVNSTTVDLNRTNNRQTKNLLRLR